MLMIRFSPYKTIPYNESMQEEFMERISQGIQRVHATIDRDARIPHAGYDDGIRYRFPPLNSFQEKVREGTKANDRVTYHYTRKYSPKVVERYIVWFSAYIAR